MAETCWEEREERTIELAQRFLRLVEIPGVTDRWKPELFDDWAASDAVSIGQRNAARLVLSYWDRKTLWKCGRFDLIEAFPLWEDQMRETFAEWAHELATGQSRV